MNFAEQHSSRNRGASKKHVAVSLALILLSGAFCFVLGAGNGATKQFINLDGKHPPGFTQVVTTPPGRTIYLSGTGGSAADGTLPKDFAAQVDNTFKNLARELKAAGADFKDVVKINYYVTDIANLQSLRDTRAKYLSLDAPPAATLVQAGLAGNLLVEIECVAVVPE